MHKHLTNKLRLHHLSKHDFAEQGALDIIYSSAWLLIYTLHFKESTYCDSLSPWGIGPVLQLTVDLGIELYVSDLKSCKVSVTPPCFEKEKKEQKTNEPNLRNGDLLGNS